MVHVAFPFVYAPSTPDIGDGYGLMISNKVLQFYFWVCCMGSKAFERSIGCSVIRSFSITRPSYVYYFLSHLYHSLYVVLS